MAAWARAGERKASERVMRIDALDGGAQVYVVVDNT
jgi:hypothetical protein